MINILLSFELIIYILFLSFGFMIAKKNKDKHNKKYLKFRMNLYIIIYSIFIYSSYVFYLGMGESKILFYVFFLNLVYIIYFSIFTWKATRCWKQHRMIIYNFLILVLIYFSSLVLENILLNLVCILIFIYNVCRMTKEIIN